MVFTGCGGELSGDMGSFSSPGYPNRYPANKECIWYIHTAPGSSIQLTIHDFDVEYHATCNFDTLEVGIQIVFFNTLQDLGSNQKSAKIPQFLPVANSVLFLDVGGR